MQHSANDTSNELKNTTYELFVAALSVLSIMNLLIAMFAVDPDIRDTVSLIDLLLSVVFLADFAYRLLTADNKRTYFLRQAGWADLLASIPAPQLKLLRLFRIWRAGRIMRRYGWRHLLEQFLSDRAGSALLTVLFLIILVLEFGGMGVLAAERASPDANIKSASDAIWWAYVSITTVGYGDRFPVTNACRLWGVLVLTAGVGLFGVLTGFLANSFLAPHPAADTAAPASGPPDDAAEALSAIRHLLEQQVHQQAVLHERLATLERQLTAAQAADTSAWQPPNEAESDGSQARRNPDSAHGDTLPRPPDLRAGAAVED